MFKTEFQSQKPENIISSNLYNIHRTLIQVEIPSILYFITFSAHKICRQKNNENGKNKNEKKHKKMKQYKKENW